MSFSLNMAADASAATAIPLGAILAHHAKRDPGAPALTIEGVTVTRSELDAAANRRARLSATLNVRPGDLVTVALGNSREFYETTFAIWKLGAIPNVVSPKLPSAEFGAIVDLVRPRLIVGVGASEAHGLNSIGANVLPSDVHSSEPLEPVISPHWKAMTSGGSTGRPKVIVDHMPGLWDPSTTAFGQIVDDVILNPGPLYHNAPFCCTHYGLFTGAHVVDMVKFDAARALELMGRYGVAWVNFVPTMLGRIMRLPVEVRANANVKGLRVVFHMAAPCPAWLKQAWIDWIGPERVFELYGGTERQGTTLISGSEWLDHVGSVGRPQSGGQIKVFREDGTEADVSEIGEIYFLPDAGRASTYHYLGASSKALGEWESLGDLGHFDADGYLYLADRRTDLVISGGTNIYPAEVEAALESFPGVACAVVIGLPDEDLGQRVHAIVEMADGQPPPAQGRVIEHVRQLIASYKAPKSVEFVAGGLRDDTGKVRRSALREARL